MSSLDDEREPLVCAGEAIVDRDGRLICRLAVDVFEGDMIEVDLFTDWTIPVPKPGDEMHAAIFAFFTSAHTRH